MTEAVELVPIDSIRPDPNQPRKLKSPDQIAGLAQNFKQKGVGIINPIEVDDQDIIVTGEMRWLAAREAGFTQIPIRRYTPETAELRFLRQMSENVHQTSVGLFRMSPMDTARALRRLCDMEVKGKFGLLPEDSDDSREPRNVRTAAATAAHDLAHCRVAGRLGISEASIRDYLKYLDSAYTPELLQQALEDGIVRPGVAHEVVRSPERYRQAFAAHVAKEAKRGHLDTHGARAVKHTLKREPTNPDEIIGALRAGETRAQTEKRLREIAPTLAEAVGALVAPGQKLEKAIESAIFAIREIGNAEALPAGTQQSAYLAVLRLRDACNEFLGDSNPELTPIDAERR